ncbi:MAG: amino acid permease [Gammaproteobacteria bacterium RIFCSPHIGHO2_12_FULL_41_20]|nr:MAG: amino acid permease [Gammaproteobacteria bacterium RIFCSPHIGHO2_12_FULL_41_20]
MTLNRRFTPLHLFMLSVNGMVGSAWLFAPLYAAKIAGTASIIAWLIGGIATSLIALTFVELSTLFPVAGGTAQIPQLSHGTLASFTLGWLAWLSALTMAPIEVQAVLQYASTYFTSLTYVNNGMPVLTKIGIVWATILMLSLCIINITSFKGLVRFNLVLFSFKVLVIILTVVTLLRVSYHPSNFIHPSNTSFFDWHAILTAVATGGIAFAFTGFKHGVELAGETKKLALAIPLAIIGSVICCLFLYIGLQTAFIGALDPSHLAKGWKNITFAGDVGPFAGLALTLGLGWLLKILYIDAAISPLGAGLIYVTSTSRILYAMSQLNFFPKFLTKLNKQNFPVAAIFVNFVIGMFLFLPLPGWQSMVSFLVSGMVISYAMGPIALLCLRIELPNEKRLFRLPAANFLCLFAFYFCNLMAYWTGWDTIYKLAIAICIGFIFFTIAYFRRKLANQSLGLKSILWVGPYLLGLFLISYLGAFGGKNILPFGWDFLIIGIFSIIILYLAIISRTNNVVEQYAHYRSLVLTA